MHLEGSCHCGAVGFSLESATPVPYQRCYCSICRKTQGGGGYAINLGGDAASLAVTGREHTRTYHARMTPPDRKPARHSKAERVFCGRCGSGLWLFDPDWPELIHPLASAIDTALPVPPEHTHLLLAGKPSWIEVEHGGRDQVFDGFPEESIAAWHERTGMTR